MMGRFKTPAPAPPTTPYSRTPLRQPAITPRSIHSRKTAVSHVSTLSLVAAFDELCRNGAVLQEDSEKHFVSHVKAAGEWRKKFKLAEAEKTRLTTLLIQKDKELAGKDYQLKQARSFVEDEVKSQYKSFEIKTSRYCSFNFRLQLSTLLIL